LLALAAAAISGVAVYVNGLAVRHFPSPTSYTTTKNLLAGALLIGASMVFANRTTTSISSIRSGFRHHGWALATVAVLGGAIPFVLFFEGLARATSTDAAFIHKTLVVWAAVLAAVFLRERLTPINIAAIALLVAGHVALAGGVGSLRLSGGELMILAATLCWAIELVVVKRLLAELSPGTVAAARLGGGSVFLLGWMAVSGTLTDLVGLSASQWLWVVTTSLILATFVTVWFNALALARVIDVTSVLVLGAVVTGLISWAAGGSINGQLAGDILILVGVAVVVAHELRHDTATSDRAIQWT
jgi:drug/metabolite transporter (DMT)-like permease